MDSTKINNHEDLAKDLEKFKLAIDNVSDNIIITDPEGIVIYANRAVEKITGYKPEEAIGKKSGVLWKTPMPPEYYQNLWDIIKKQKKVFIGEIQNKRKNGEVYTAKISISPILDKNGEIIYFVGIERDITKEKEIDKAKTEFVSIASHQLRTPLTTIGWYTEMLLAGDAGQLNDEQRKYLEEVYQSNKRMVKLIDSLLNTSRLELGTFVVEPELTDVVKLVEDTANEQKLQIDERKIQFSSSFEKGIPLILIDQKLLRMVVQNLLSNALKYTPEKGTVNINVRLVKHDSFVSSQKMKEDCALLSVSDNGYGIPKNQQDKIFTKLFRAENVLDKDPVGTGLGLYIVKSIVDRFGGMIWFESEENKNTIFYVTIPLAGIKKKQ